VPPARKKWRMVFVLLTACIGIGLFPLLYKTAKRVAECDSLDRRRGHARTITFVLKPGTEKFYPRSFLCQNKYHRLKLLAQTPTNYYVFYQPPGENGVLPIFSTYDILRSDIILAEIEIP